MTRLQSSRYVASIYTTPAVLKGYYAPSSAPRYSYVKSLATLFEWVPNSAATADDVLVIAPNAGPEGRWVAVTDTYSGRLQIIATQTSTYTAIPNSLVPYDTSGGAFTITLPSAALSKGLGVVFKEAGASTTALTIQRAGSDTIEGGTSISATLSGARFSLFSDGSDWIVMGSYS